jgi:hypothetical protein
MTAFATAARDAGQGRPRRHVRGDSRRRLRCRSEAPHHDRHLCALGRLLRRLFQPGAEGEGAHRPRFRARVERVRSPPHPDRALGRLRARRESRTIRSQCI